MAVTEKRRTTLLATSGILVALVAANTASWFLFRGARIDVTEERLYSLSPGVREIMKKLPEPVRLDFYWTREQGADNPQIRSYAQRVQEFLEEMTAASDGMIQLRIIDPEPFSETEDMAKSAGIAPRNLDATGRVLMLGLSVRSSTDKLESIPFLDPSQEPYLEYEIARRIVTVGRGKKSTVAYLSTLPEDKQFDPRNPQAQPGKNIMLAQLDQLYDLKRVSPADVQIPADAAALVIVQPRKLDEKALRAIEAWTLSGKPTIVFADPWCESDPDARNLDVGSTSAGTTYDLGPLLAQWGVDIKKDMVLADRGSATRIGVRTQGGQLMELDYLPWLTLKKAALNAEDPLTERLAELHIKSAGAIMRRADAKTSLTPIIESTKDAQEIQSLKLGFFGEADRLVRDFKPIGAPQAIAVRIKGPVESAFPGADGTRARGEVNILLVSDADLLQDDTWVQADGQGGLRAIADNGPLVVGALEQATGDKLLSGLRSRGGYARPFDKVESIRKDAEMRYLTREQELQDQIKKGQMRINELQRERGGAGAGVDANGMLVLTDEQTKELTKIEQSSAQARKELREVQRSLRSDIERTGTMLMVLNVILWPLAVATLATGWISLRYRRQLSK